MVIADLEYIAAHMREQDKREIYGMRWNEDPQELAFDTGLALNAGVGRLFHSEGKPAAVCGAMPVRAGVWSAFCYGTNEFHKVAKEITAYAQGELALHLKSQAHRVECQSRFDHDRAHRWLAWLGAERESTLRKFGSDGADYFNFVWTRG